MGTKRLSEPSLLELAREKFNKMFSAQVPFIEADPFLSGDPSINCGTVYYEDAAREIFPKVISAICRGESTFLISTIQDGERLFFSSDDLSPSTFEHIAEEFPYFDTYLY